MTEDKEDRCCSNWRAHRALHHNTTPEIASFSAIRVSRPRCNITVMATTLTWLRIVVIAIGFQHEALLIDAQADSPKSEGGSATCPGDVSTCLMINGDEETCASPKSSACWCTRLAYVRHCCQPGKSLFLRHVYELLTMLFVFSYAAFF